MSNFVSLLWEKFRSMGWREVGLLMVLGALSASLWVAVEVMDWVVEAGIMRWTEKIIRALRQPSGPVVLIGPGWSEECGAGYHGAGQRAGAGLCSWC